MILPRIAVTLGDPTGIGPEVILKALADPELQQSCAITIVGSAAHLHRVFQQLRETCDRQGQPLADPSQLTVWDVSLDVALMDEIRLGQPSVTSGSASFAYVEAAIAQTLAGKFDAIVTGPIAKSYWQAAGHNYPGQTELLAQKSHTHQFGMAFVARSPHTNWTLRTLLATTHIPLRQVPDALSPTLLDQKLRLLIQTLHQDFAITHPRIAIAGLNPHSGEQGHLGSEEQTWLTPWLAQARQTYPQAHLDGPIPPDTLWVKPGQAWYGLTANGLRLEPGLGPEQGPAPIPTNPGGHDAYLALYHDQGLIPVKLLAFDRAVNTTIGLPFVRTSPDHGTAFDIAAQGIARCDSMTAAIEWAIELVQNRARNRV
jgi:4-hydroxythreonine-4-phosphate dehydrogenase